MSEKTKTELISILITFLSSFFTVIGSMLAGGVPMQFTTPAIIALLLAGVRAGVKAVLESKLHSVAGVKKV
jgi:hypothetical protein